MNKYIIELLQVRTSLILPDFGSFLVTKSTGAVKFNPLLRFNDNVLVNYIAEKEGIDAKEALNQVAKFVREIKAQLDKGESFEIFNLGKFSKNEKGAVVFEAGGKIESKTPETKTEVVTPTPEVKKEEPKIEEKKVETLKVEEKKETPKVEEPKVEEKKEAPKVEEKVETPKVEDKKIEEKKEDVKNVYIPPKEEAKKETEASKPKETPEKKPVENKKTKEVKKKEPKKKKKRIFLKIIIILILLLAGGITAGHFFLHEQTNKILSKAGFTTDDIFGFLDKKEEVKEEPVVKEPIVEEIIEEEFVEEEPIIENNTGSINGSFHIIGNSFGSETNAQKYVSDLQSKGYSSAKILGKFDNLFMVAVKSYDSSADAQSDLSNIKNDVPKAWVFKHPK